MKPSFPLDVVAAYDVVDEEDGANKLEGNDDDDNREGVMIGRPVEGGGGSDESPDGGAVALPRGCAVTMLIGGAVRMQ